MMDEMVLKIVVDSNQVEITDQGEYGKMTPRPAVEYWKNLAEKYRENARRSGEALNKERDRNATLRGKLLNIEKILSGRK